ncbi:MAG: hypothetical protein ABI114_16160 [Rhodanobacter sp.]
MRIRDVDRQIRNAGENASNQVRDYADKATDRARSWLDSGRRAGARVTNRGDNYGQQLTRVAEDFADEANYRYRRLRRQASRHPGATAAIVVGTVGAFLLLRRAFRSNDDD